MATTTNFGWETPDDTDLVKDGALAIRTLGSAIDTSLVDLKGGTTGQVLSKNSNNDMDFTWVAQDDSNAIQNAIVDAKGDLIAATAADTPARLAVGNNGETLVADSSATTGLRWQGNYAAGKNIIINGDFNIWQRGTSFTSAGYNADRWSTQSDATFTTSRQTFTPGSAPVAGYEGKYFYRLAKNSGGTYIGFTQRIEDVQTFAGQTVTVSLWAKADSATTLVRAGAQNFGSGGSTQVNLSTQSQAITTSWARYSFTFTLPSISGKTIGTSSYLEFNIYILESGAKTLDIWGVQLEAGSTATAFQTATGTLQGELAACQRYFNRYSIDSNQRVAAVGAWYSTTLFYPVIHFPVEMRTYPTLTLSAQTIFTIYSNGGSFVSTAAVLETANVKAASLKLTSSGATSGNAGWVNISTANAYADFSAEL